MPSRKLPAARSARNYDFRSGPWRHQPEAVKESWKLIKTKNLMDNGYTSVDEPGTAMEKSEA